MIATDNPLIRKLEGIVDLTVDDRAVIRSLCTEVRDVSAKRHIIREGECPEYVHLILKGWAARYKVLPNGSRQFTAFLIPGDFCDLHVEILEKMDHGIMALTPCKVAYLDGDKLDVITSQRTALTKGLWWMTLVDAAVLRQWIVNLGRRDAFEAIAHLLCEMHLRMEAIGLVEDGRFELPLTQEELADATGFTKVHFNRTLQKLRSEGLIELRQHILTILDIASLRKKAGFDDTYLHVRSRRTGKVQASMGYSSSSQQRPAYEGAMR